MKHPVQGNHDRYCVGEQQQRRQHDTTMMITAPIMQPRFAGQHCEILGFYLVQLKFGGRKQGKSTADSRIY